MLKKLIPLLAFVINCLIANLEAESITPNLPSRELEGPWRLSFDKKVIEPKTKEGGVNNFLPSIPFPMKLFEPSFLLASPTHLLLITPATQSHFFGLFLSPTNAWKIYLYSLVQKRWILKTAPIDFQPKVFINFFTARDQLVLDMLEGNESNLKWVRHWIDLQSGVTSSAELRKKGVLAAAISTRHLLSSFRYIYLLEKKSAQDNSQQTQDHELVLTKFDILRSVEKSVKVPSGLYTLKVVFAPFSGREDDLVLTLEGQAQKKSYQGIDLLESNL